MVPSGCILQSRNPHRHPGFIVAALALCRIAHNLGPLGPADPASSSRSTPPTARPSSASEKRIPLELSFTGPDGGNFQVSTATYDRSGRMVYEDFDVKPANGWADPLATYFVFGKTSMGGISSGPHMLSSTPFLLPLNLNEWVRFDQPGDYTVTVSSHRVGSGIPPFGNHSPLALPVEPHSRLHIIAAATPDWQDKQFAAIIAQLNPPFAPGMQSPARASTLSPISAFSEPRLPSTSRRRTFATIARNSSANAPSGSSASPRPCAPPRSPPSTANSTTQTSPSPTNTSELQSHSSGAPTLLAKSCSKRASVPVTPHGRAVLESLPRKNNKAQAATAQILTIDRGTERSPQQKAQLASVLASRLLDLPPSGEGPAALL